MMHRQMQWDVRSQMGTNKNFYQTLGLLQQADEVVIKAAYKALAQKHHPDKNKTHQEFHTQVMAKLNAAYAALGTESKRKAYDELLKRASEGKPVSPKKSKQPVNAHDELIQKLEISALDEMVVVALFEQHFSTKVTINAGWMNTYSVKQGHTQVTFGFTELKSKIIEKLKQQ